MSQPARQRPGSASPIKKLTPDVEPVQTPASAAVDEPQLSVDDQATMDAVGAPAPPSPSSKTQRSPKRSADTENSPREASIQSDDPKVPVTLGLRGSLKRMSETAVLRVPDEYRSFAGFVEGAIERELKRMADLYNGGVPFEQNNGSFRRGRPFNS